MSVSVIVALQCNCACFWTVTKHNFPYVCLSVDGVWCFIQLLDIGNCTDKWPRKIPKISKTVDAKFSCTVSHGNTLQPTLTKKLAG